MSKLNFDTSNLPLFQFLSEGKRLGKLSFACSKDLEDFVTDFARRMDISRSELCNRYIIAGLKSDLEKVLLIQEYKDRPLADVLKILS
ncbi:MAG: hypothetical protein M0R74_13490 [Dehalococcoidia bacterium]|nr:hypothetical protein [Dehalococcoidia bacterium]